MSFVDYEKPLKLLKLRAIQRFNAISQQALSLRLATDTKEKHEIRRQQESDGEERSNDRDATALGRCEEVAGSAAKVITPMRSMAG